ncbi:hypothetical protein NDU88_008975 [Pleurodeles waltl]|uniref:Uncharacterized protein n=1 Tax=Pleurodeles waltl TaxID=8319 RepID=A0AAV7QQ83_PLEWA|nr:hypothetical protein NDU88_008975 [Pleurodeles waltl]
MRAAPRGAGRRGVITYGAGLAAMPELAVTESGEGVVRSRGEDGEKAQAQACRCGQRPDTNDGSYSEPYTFVWGSGEATSEEAGGVYRVTRETTAQQGAEL